MTATVATVGIDERLAKARRGLNRVTAQQLPALQQQGAFVIDIRLPRTREPEGHIPGAIVVDRLVLEWRLDPTSGFGMTDGPTHDNLVIVVCNEGYSSSLAARDLQAIGFRRATDLVDGFRAYADAGLPVVGAPTRYVD